MRITLTLSAALLILAACADGGAPQGPYSYTTSTLGSSDYQITLSGNPGVSEKELKKYFKVHGRKLCGDKVFLLRGVKDTYLKSEKRHVMVGDVDCVETDYFQNK